MAENKIIHYLLPLPLKREKRVLCLVALVADERIELR